MGEPAHTAELETLITEIVDAATERHRKHAVEYYNALENIASLATLLECATAEPPVKPRKAELGNSLDYCIAQARKALAKAEG